MRVFISHSLRDRDAVARIVGRLRRDGHEIWILDTQLGPGDNVELRVRDGLEQADALVVIISQNSFRSKWVQLEFTTIALQQVSKRERRIVPVKIDDGPVPSYLGDRPIIDLSENFEAGLDQLSEALSPKEAESFAVTASPVRQPQPLPNREPKVQRLREALRRGRLTLVCGAGVSMKAGIPTWENLLVRLLERMMERISKDHSLDLGRKAATEFQKRYGASALILGKYLKNNLGRDFPAEMRNALYADNPTTSPLIEGIVNLARPQRDGRPLDSIITFNFDCLIEEALDKARIQNKAIFSEAIQHGSDQLPIYHVHGYLPRSGNISGDTDLVFSEDAYHSQFIDPFSWSNLILLNKLTQSTCLFLGISLTDPNMRRLLDVAWRKNPDKRLSHVIARRPERSSPGDVLDDVSRILEEQDANALGLDVLWFDSFESLPGVLSELSGGR